MHFRRLLLLLNLLSISLFAQSQGKTQSGAKVFFDKSGRNCSPDVSYYYRVPPDTGDLFQSYYTQNDKLYFQGKISAAHASDDNKNVYAGACKWFYRNGHVKISRKFDEKGLETGLTQYYYESGRLWKEFEFENGNLRSPWFFEYNEDGSKNKILEDEFTKNVNEWDLYSSDKSTATIQNGIFEIRSTSKEGTSRYINYPIESNEYTLEATLNIAALKENEKVGIIYGFKDWQNYHYFAISKKNIYIGSFYEGVKSTDINDMFCSAIDPLRPNVIKVLCNGEKEYFSVNGEIQFKDDINRLYGNNIGFIVGGTGAIKVEKFVIKEMDVTETTASQKSIVDTDVKLTGSGILFSRNGHILTNHHVIENASRFTVELNNNGVKNNYRAEVVISDKDNDIAILQIKDPPLQNFELNYSFKENGLMDVGSTVFTIGFPYALSGMGKEAKFTDGKISSKTGYNGSINSFQTTIPVQPGNSGGPVFNESGQLVGLINATFKEADNVSYAIKLNYIKNLIELLPDKVDLPNSAVLATLSLEEKLKIITNYVVLIKVK
jgi:S1-C subfamily serine protease